MVNSPIKQLYTSSSIVGSLRHCQIYNCVYLKAQLTFTRSDSRNAFTSNSVYRSNCFIIEIIFVMNMWYNIHMIRSLIVNPLRMPSPIY